MSRIGRMPIPVPKGVEVKVEGQNITVKGPKGTLGMVVMPNISVEVQGDHVLVSRASELKPVRAAHGMTRALINNMVSGVSKGFEKILEINGVGYRAQMQGSNLVLALGFSHPVEVVPPAGIEISVDGPTKVIVRGIDRQKVGQIAANIRGYRPPEPYKGKGIRYAGEYVIRKAGKSGSK